MQEIQGYMDDVLSRKDLREVTIKKLSGTFNCKTDTLLWKTRGNNQRYDSNSILHSP